MAPLLDRCESIRSEKDADWNMMPFNSRSVEINFPKSKFLNEITIETTVSTNL